MADMVVDAAFIAQQAAVLEHALDLVDTGAFARRGIPGEVVARRAAVAAADARLREHRVGLLMWTLHSRCTGLHLADGSPWPAHPVTEHRAQAEAGVDVLFPASLV